MCIAKDGDQNANRLIRKLASNRICIEIDKNVPEEAISTLKALALDLIVLAWWPYILKSNILNLSKRGCINFHPSFLPHCRGMDPNFWCLIEGRPFGVSLHFADITIDGGDIIFQRYIKVNWEDTGQSLLNRAKEQLVKLYADHIEEILTNSFVRQPQTGEGSFHRRNELKEISHFNLDQPTTARQLLNFLRARMFDAPPGAAWFTDRNGKQYEVRVYIKRKE